MFNENDIGKMNQSEGNGNQIAPATFVNQPMNAVGPNFSISKQPEGGKYMKNHQGPALFGQNQLKNGFGPVYAVPSIPWEGPPPVVTATTLEKELAQSQPNSKPPTSSERIQAKEEPDLGHHATRHDDNQYIWQNQWKPCNCYARAAMPYYVYTPYGY
ncbi:hypothetical protein [Virgibacillus oceani]|uniref:Uncharacterized protein n=1 Tax=Virgibacillus oceani TaxID=1479511 RepID=A0A917HGE2_9BACI|nr:hypothetical protein [Virgibacillus oceani]GGG78370.1 hypothetical protein GCM10011398_24520 [Virgibacillus oceani]